ncbi:MAG: type II toxin-antitoxin system RnlB family antitoxin [Clostridia bacterium]|nr:type II toxin-antitoxin system RnlB family antitoxin [Clostridia bacterium]
MKEYAVHKLFGKEYDGFLLCLTFDSILSYLTNIEKEPIISNTKGTLLIDQLLITGNGRNRYIVCTFDHGKIDLSSTQNIFPDDCYKKLSIELLQENFELLQYSILTDKQKEYIRQGIIF